MADKHKASITYDLCVFFFSTVFFFFPSSPFRRDEDEKNKKAEADGRAPLSEDDI